MKRKHASQNLKVTKKILGHKSSLSKIKKVKTVSSIFSDHNTMRLDISYKKKTVRNTNTQRLNNTFLNNQQVTEEITKGNEKTRNKWQWKHNSKPMGWSKNSPKREVYSNTILPQETRKTSNRQSNFTPKTTGKRRTKPPKLVEGKKS